MTKIRRAGYVFIKWIGDHPPRHVHIYRDRRLVLKFNQDARIAMRGKLDRKLLNLIELLEAEGKI